MKRINFNKAFDKKISIKNLTIVALMQVTLYLIQFIIIPLTILKPENYKSLTIWMISLVIFTLVAMWKINDKIVCWIITIPIYYFLINFYIPEGVYRINYRDPIFAYMTSPNIEIIVIGALIIEVSVWIFVKILKYISKISNCK